MHSNVSLFPSIHAGAGFEASAVVHAHKTGINPVELDALAQSIGRLARDHSTVVPLSMRGDLLSFRNSATSRYPKQQAQRLPSNCSAQVRCSQATSGRFVPRHLQSCSLKVAVMSHLQHPEPVQHCSVVFRVPGAREATRQFLHELGTKFPGDQAEIIAIQAGNVLADKDVDQ